MLLLFLQTGISNPRIFFSTLTVSLITMRRELLVSQEKGGYTGNAKLGDFGLARVLSERTALAHTFVGSPYYMSPVSSRHVC